MFNNKELENKIINGEELTADEIKYVYYKRIFEQVDRFGGDDCRWVRPITVIYKINDSYYSIYYYKGLTEYQEDEFESQVANEVEKRPVAIYEWVKVD